ncbi:hypothetical protein [Methanospirillum lacunae]|uniref:Uncharacterized protein n=1 Tax=Methanospirillum lacunae TaxID=668570 RepID=A0A2V2N4D9_9EURY|nr:hypothetical protein [Methanospirillum lacunae]PWR71378.1 hypothetical protein DK846_10960 [Methanospirillum lacunae]
MKFDNYLSGYLDRRMSLIIEEWQLSTRNDLTDLTQRFHRVQDELVGLKSFERETSTKLSDLETRVRLLKEKVK